MVIDHEIIYLHTHEVQLNVVFLSGSTKVAIFIIPGWVAQSETCLTVDTCLTADHGVGSLIPACPILLRRLTMK